MNRKEKLYTDQYYHVYNRGVEKRLIFLSNHDYSRFVDTLFHYLITNEKYTLTLDSTKKSAESAEAASEVVSEKGFVRPVELLAYCLKPNNFHLELKQRIDGGISRYIHRVVTSLTNYFNKKNERVGPLLQGRFKYKRIESEEQMIYVSKYIHRNPINPEEAQLTTTDNLLNYPWSSLPSYVSGQKDLLYKDSILVAFGSPNDYKQFVLENYDENQSESFKYLNLE